MTDSAATAAYGAPLAVRAGQTPDFFVRDVIARRAVTLLGAAASPAQAEASIRVAPVPAVVHQRADLATNATHWPLAHPVFVALDLAQDAGRGHEILEDWTPPQEWTRVRLLASRDGGPQPRAETWWAFLPHLARRNPEATVEARDHRGRACDQ